MKVYNSYLDRCDYMYYMKCWCCFGIATLTTLTVFREAMRLHFQLVSIFFFSAVYEEANALSFIKSTGKCQSVLNNYCNTGFYEPVPVLGWRMSCDTVAGIVAVIAARGGTTRMCSQKRHVQHSF